MPTIATRFIYRRTNGETKSQAQKQMRHEASHLMPHRSWNLILPSRRQERRDDGTGPTALRGAPLLPAPAAKHDSENRVAASYAVGQRPIPLIEQEVEEAAMPGQPARTRAHFRFFPWQFTLENRQLPPASPQSIVWQVLRVPTFSVKPLWGRRPRAQYLRRCARNFTVLTGVP